MKLVFIIIFSMFKWASKAAKGIQCIFGGDDEPGNRLRKQTIKPIV